MARVLGFLVMAVLLWADTAPGAEPLPEKRRVRLPPGTQRVMTLPPEVRGFAVRDENLVEARYLGNRHLLLVGLREGPTELLLLGPSGLVERIDIWLEIRDACTLVICEPCRLLPKGHLLRTGGRGDVPVLSGIVHTLEEARGVKLLAERYPQVQIEARLSRRALREGLLRVNHLLWRAGFLHARASVKDGRVQLSGRFANEADEASARDAIAPVAGWLELPIEEEPAPAP